MSTDAIFVKIGDTKFINVNAIEFWEIDPDGNEGWIGYKMIGSDQEYVAQEGESKELRAALAQRTPALSMPAS